MESKRVESREEDGHQEEKINGNVIENYQTKGG